MIMTTARVVVFPLVSGHPFVQHPSWPIQYTYQEIFMKSAVLLEPQNFTLPAVRKIDSSQRIRI